MRLSRIFNYWKTAALTHKRPVAVDRNRTGSAGVSGRKNVANLASKGGMTERTVDGIRSVSSATARASWPRACLPGPP